MKKNTDLNKKLIILIGDIVLITLSVWLSVAIRLQPVSVVTYYTGATLFVVFSYVLSFYVFDLYELKKKMDHTAFLTEYLTAITAGTALVAVVFYSFLHWKFGRGIILINAFYTTVFTFLWRVLVRRLNRYNYEKSRVLIVGAGASGRAMCNILKDREEYEVLGLVDDDEKNMGKEMGGYSVIGSSGIIPGFAREKKVDEIIVAITNEKRKDLISVLLEAKMKGVRVYDMQAVYEKVTGKLPVSHLREGWLAYAEMHGTEEGVYKIKVKRVISFLGALFLILVTLPVSVVVMAAIKMESKGPVFFRQKRVGFRGEVFEVVKFRSMVDDAESNGAVWASENDPRVTKVGKVIRKLRIDELPQLWNVIKGEMSIVGPRPERPEFVEELQKTIPFYFIRHVVKPGVTGWAQINFKYGASKEDALEKLQYDLYYVKNLSFFLDTRVILKTIRVVVFGVGAR
jgi:sugar transferase (PEP-CTERM system associated)